MNSQQYSYVVSVTNSFFLAVTNSFFLFNEQLYRQKEGLGMGLPISPVMANIFMGHHECKWLSDCPPDFAPISYSRYVDDCFLVFKQKQHAQLFLEYVNSKHPNISFTMEVEQNNKIPFLDVLISRDNNKFNSTVYRKPTFSGMGLSYFSHCVRKFKLNSIKSLISRAYGICSSYYLLDLEFQFIRKHLKNNGFPTTLVNDIIGSFLNNRYDRQNYIDSSAQCFYVTLPYFGKHSEKLKSDLSVLFCKYFKDISFNFILVNSFKIDSFFSFKDRLPKGMRSSLIYKYSCVRCTSEYIGSTTRILTTRVAEHAGRSHRTDRILANPPHSNIRDHAETCGSPIVLDNFNIIDSCNNSNDLRILESLYIHKERPSLNNMQSAHPLYIVSK